MSILGECYHAHLQLIRALPRITRRFLSISKVLGVRTLSHEPKDDYEAHLRQVLYQIPESSQEQRDRSLVHGVSGSINDVPVFASTASETRYNIISESFARRCGIEIQKSTASFALSKKRILNASGKAAAVWDFDGEPMAMEKVEFVVLPECSRPVILGNDFLKRTKTLTTNWHRLKVQSVPAENFACVHLLGEAPQYITGRIRRKPVYAIPATGCEVNLISERYILSRGLTKNMDEDSKVWVKLMDGSLIQTIGEIRMPWSFGSERGLNTWPWLYFSVLPDCLYDVVIGQEIIYDSNAFLRYTECFKDLTSKPCYSLRQGIGTMPYIFLKLRRKPGIPDAVRATGDSSILVELNRRAAADHEILKMPKGDKHAAWTAEQERRAKWNSGINSEESKDSGNSKGSLNADSSATDASSQSLASSIKDHSLLSGDHTSSSLKVGLDSDEGSESNDGSDWDYHDSGYD